MRNQLLVIERDRAPRLADRMRRGVRGYAVTYRPGELNRCPSCGCKQWHVGRITATCSGCALPLSIAADGRDGAG